MFSQVSRTGLGYIVRTVTPVPQRSCYINDYLIIFTETACSNVVCFHQRLHHTHGPSPSDPVSHDCCTAGGGEQPSSGFGSLPSKEAVASMGLEAKVMDSRARRNLVIHYMVYPERPYIVHSCAFDLFADVHA